MPPLDLLLVRARKPPIQVVALENSSWWCQLNIFIHESDTFSAIGPQHKILHSLNNLALHGVIFPKRYNITTTTTTSAVTMGELLSVGDFTLFRFASMLPGLKLYWGIDLRFFSVTGYCINSKLYYSAIQLMNLWFSVRMLNYWYLSGIISIEYAIWIIWAILVDDFQQCSFIVESFQ